MALTGPLADPGTPMTDELGLLDLSLFPLSVLVRVEADDLDAPVVELWPDEVPEEIPEQVELSVSVKAGQDRRVFLELFYMEEELPPATYVSPAPGEAPAEVDVVAGRTVPVELTLSELPTARVRATWPGGVQVEAVAWVDDSAGVVWPPVAVESGAAEAVIATGRTFWPRVWLSDGSQLNLDSQRVRSTVEGETLDLELDLP
jgi:hypothetical protein